MSSNSFAYWLFHAITFERKVFSIIHESKSKKRLRETREYRWLWIKTGAEAARAGTDGYTDRLTHVHTRNPRACAPRVNYSNPLAHARRGLITGGLGSDYINASFVAVSVAITERTLLFLSQGYAGNKYI